MQQARVEIATACVSQARRLVREEYLPRIERCLAQLSQQQIWWRPNEESNSIGNLVLHLAGNARQWIICGLGGAVDQRQRDQEFSQREELPGEELIRRLTETLSEVDRVLTQLDLSRMLGVRQIQGLEVTTLEAVLHVTEHFSMHTGQIILLTKLQTGKDLHFYDFEGGVPIKRWK